MSGLPAAGLQPSTDGRLLLDSVYPLADNVRRALDYLA